MSVGEVVLLAGEFALAHIAAAAVSAEEVAAVAAGVAGVT